MVLGGATVIRPTLRHLRFTGTSGLVPPCYRQVSFERTPSLGSDTQPVVRVTGVTVTYVGHHGDPYVFPAGFAEQERVTKRLEHPIPERPEAHKEPRPVRG